IVRAIGRHLSETGVLGKPGDIFYLTWDEVHALAHGRAATAPHNPGEPVRSRVTRRRGEAERNRSVRLPETFRGRPVPLAVAGDATPAAASVLKGIPVSPGRVTGVARVILDPRSGEIVAPGEILVAPVTDAGWTPLFLNARALVVDIGGSLSHGATVARELGLPAVV